jgi:hypothetical protein
MQMGAMENKGKVEEDAEKGGDESGRRACR